MEAGDRGQTGLPPKFPAKCPNTSWQSCQSPGRHGYNRSMRYLVILAFALLAQAQGTQPKASAAEYPVQAVAGNLAIGAEYTVHSFGSGEQMYLAENYLVVEVALFPPKGESVTADAAGFALRVNGKKTL